MMRRGRFTAALLAAAVALPALVASPVAAGKPVVDLLPDLQMAPLFNLYVSTAPGGKKKLRYGTLVENVGDGPIEVRGRRRRGDEMTRVRQYIYRDDGSGYSVLKPGAEIYYAGDGHDHWHVEEVVVSRLTAMPGTTAQARKGRKLNFCLVDSSKMNTDVPPNQAPFPHYFGCGNSASQSVTMGISVGWGDIYGPELAYQAVDVTGLPVGNYKLCATVNKEGVWTEKGNNSVNNYYWVELALNPKQNTVSVTNEGNTAC
jgi:hypothetical protein